MERHYKLDDNHELVPCDLLTWAEWLETAGEKRVVGQQVVGRFWVSTACLGLDHDFSAMHLIREYGGGIPVDFYRPLVFETMVFMAAISEIEMSSSKKKMKYHEPQGYQTRYRSWDDAKAGHEHAVKLMTRYDRMLTHHQNVLARLEGDL
jgi:hypothetical protein